jgi:(p)ppGpp synthase/HD superfamily hydrolase
MMSDETKDHKKELARLKRLATEIAGTIHDIVEDTVWTESYRLPELGKELAEAVEKANAYKKEHGL